MRLRPRALPADVAQKARMVRSFLEAGHVVVVEHLFRARDPAGPEREERLARHYEVIADELRGLSWLARGPFVEPDRVHGVFLGDSAAAPMSAKGRYARKLAGRKGRARVTVRLDPAQSSAERAATLARIRDALDEGRIVTLTQVGAPLSDEALAAALPGVRFEPLGPFQSEGFAVETLLLPACVAELLAGRGLEVP